MNKIVYRVSACLVPDVGRNPHTSTLPDSVLTLPTILNSILLFLNRTGFGAQTKFNYLVQLPCFHLLPFLMNGQWRILLLLLIVP
jgi:hypothetical protein